MTEPTSGPAQDDDADDASASTDPGLRAAPPVAADRPVRKVRFTTGTGTAVVGRRAVLLVDAGATHPLVVAGSRAVDADDGPTRFVQALSEVGLHRLPAFAAAFDQGPGAHVVVRGGAAAVAWTGPGRRIDVRADSLLTWAEELLPPARTVDLVLPSASDESLDGAAYESTGGTVPAGRARIGPDPTAEPGQPAEPGGPGGPAGGTRLPEPATGPEPRRLEAF